MLAAPFMSLILASVIFPRASFLGHASGIAVGLLVSALICCFQPELEAEHACAVQQVGLGLCEWLSPLGLLGLVVWLAALMVLEAVQAGRVRLPFVHSQPRGEAEQGLLEVSEV